MKYRTWINGRRPARHFCIASLRECNSWSDLIRLAKWYVAIWLDRSSDYCWAELCLWAWNRPGEESPKGSGAECQREVLTRGCCYCGKFNDLKSSARPSVAITEVAR